MSVAWYTCKVAAEFPVRVEAESKGEAARIVEGVLENAMLVAVFENGTNVETCDDHLESKGPFTFTRGTFKKERE
jgi:hypothetical protein